MSSENGLGFWRKNKNALAFLITTISFLIKSDQLLIQPVYSISGEPQITLCHSGMLSYGFYSSPIVVLLINQEVQTLNT